VYAYIYEGNGKIIREISTSTEEMLLANIETGDDYVISEEPLNVDLYYVSNGEAVQRPSMDISVEGSVIAGIHEGSTITLGGQSFQVDDGEADIEGYSGVVQITCWPYIDEEVEI